MLYRIELFRLFENRTLVVDDLLRIQIFLTWPHYRLIFASWLNKRIDHSARVVVAFQRPAERVLGCLKQSHPTSSLLGNMVIDVFAVHIPLSKVTTFILEDLTIQGQNLGEQTNIDLFVQLIG